MWGQRRDPYPCRPTSMPLGGTISARPSARQQGREDAVSGPVGARSNSGAFGASSTGEGGGGGAEANGERGILRRTGRSTTHLHAASRDTPSPPKKNGGRTSSGGGGFRGGGGGQVAARGCGTRLTDADGIPNLEAAPIVTATRQLSLGFFGARSAPVSTPFLCVGVLARTWRPYNAPPSRPRMAPPRTVLPKQQLI